MRIKLLYLGGQDRFVRYYVSKQSNNKSNFIGTRHFIKPNYVYEPIWETFFSATSRLIWACGICWIIYSTNNGYGGSFSFNKSD